MFFYEKIIIYNLECVFILNSMINKYKIDVLPIFKKSENTIFDSRIKILDALIDYTKVCLIKWLKMNMIVLLLATIMHHHIWLHI